MPYQFVPSLTNEIMSIAEAVAVIVGAVPPGHFIAPVGATNVAVVMPVAACVNLRINDLPAPCAGKVNVQAVDAVNVAVNTVPVVNTKVLVPATVPTACNVST